MKILSRHNDVVWVDYHGTRRPGITRADLKAGCYVLRRFARGVRRVSPTLRQVTPLVIPGVGQGPLRWLHERLLIAQIRRAVRGVAGRTEKPLQVWSFAPDVPFLAGRLGEEWFVYYCVDEYSQFEGIDVERIRAVEGEMIRRADMVVTTSEPLLRSKRLQRSDALLMRHGVEFDHFAAAWRGSPALPRDLAAVPKPVFGFFGLIQFWIDCRLIADVASLRPDYSFVLIGDCAMDVSPLRRLPNVHLLGRRPYDSLPAYCAGFSAGLMPFKRSVMTQNVNPIKMYEYLAAGLPVVSTPLPEAERLRGPILIAEDAEAFAQACDQVLDTNYPGRRKAISRIVEHESWLSKVEQLSEVIQQRLGQTAKMATMPVERVGLPGAVAPQVEVELVR